MLSSFPIVSIFAFLKTLSYCFSSDPLFVSGLAFQYCVLCSRFNLTSGLIVIERQLFHSFRD